MNARFLTPLDVRLLPETDTARWMLLSPLPFYSEVMGRVIEVPVGFVTDFVSFEPLKNIGQRAAVVHDFLYSCADVEREIADRVFHEALDSIGVNADLADAMFDAVRLFGGGHKEANRRLDP